MSGLRVEAVADQVIAEDAANARAGARLGKAPAITIEEREYGSTIAGRRETGGPIPAWVIGGLVGLLVVFLVGGGFAVGLFGGRTATPTQPGLGGGSPSARPIVSSPSLVSAGPSASPVAVAPVGASSSPAESAALELFPPNTVYDGCLLIEPTGNTTVIAAAFTLANPRTGDYTAVFELSPTGPLSGAGPAEVGQNPIVTPNARDGLRNLRPAVDHRAGRESGGPRSAGESPALRAERRD
jgi:hypothetical protein